MLARNLISGSVCELNARHRLSDNVRMLIWTSYMYRHVQSVIIIQPNVKWLLSLLSVASNCILGTQDRLYIRRVRGIMRKNFANYAQRFQRLCAHFLPIMHTFKNFGLFALLVPIGCTIISREDHCFFLAFSSTYPLMKCFQECWC